MSVWSLHMLKLSNIFLIDMGILIFKIKCILKVGQKLIENNSINDEKFWIIQAKDKKFSKDSEFSQFKTYSMFS